MGWSNIAAYIIQRLQSSAMKSLLVFRLLSPSRHGTGFHILRGYQLTTKAQQQHGSLHEGGPPE